MKHKQLTFVPLLLLCVYGLIALSDIVLAAVRDVSSNAFLAVSIVELLVLLVPLAFYTGMARLSFVKIARLKLPRLRDIPFILYVSGAFLFGAATIKFLTANIFGEAAAETSSLISVSLYTSNTPLVILCFILLPAILEQVLFTGLVLSEYRPYGGIFAVATVSIVYAMAHFSLENFVFHLFCALMLALVCEVTDSILPSVLLAAIANAADLYLENRFMEYVTQTGTGGLLFYFFGGLFLLFCVLGVTYLERSYRRRARSAEEGARHALEEMTGKKDEDEKKRALSVWHRFRLIYLSPMFVLLIALFLLLAIGIL